ncbi:MAG: hypothetical protein OEY61_13505 [Gammaproteobacteria bacterium]|nr:hypothetical protein [Gammaproteobacteria bacterium]
MNSMFLYTRHNEVPVLHTREGKVEAIYYNEVQTALKKLGRQIRFPIPKLKHLDLILQKDAWIVIDRALHDFPILAWTDFKTEGRQSLLAPVQCEVRIFHFAASMILRRTLEAMDLMLGEQLAEIMNDEKADVLPFKKD